MAERSRPVVAHQARRRQAQEDAGPRRLRGWLHMGLEEQAWTEIESDVRSSATRCAAGNPRRVPGGVPQLGRVAWRHGQPGPWNRSRAGLLGCLSLHWCSSIFWELSRSARQKCNTLFMKAIQWAQACEPRLTQLQQPHPGKRQARGHDTVPHLILFTYIRRPTVLAPQVPPDTADAFTVSSPCAASRPRRPSPPSPLFPISLISTDLVTLILILACHGVTTTERAWYLDSTDPVAAPVLPVPAIQCCATVECNWEAGLRQSPP